MKTMKSFLGIFAFAALMASCLNNDEETYRAGFPVLKTKSMYFYANNTNDSLYVLGYGSWTIRNLSGADWLTLTHMKGTALIEYAIGVNFSENYSDKGRSAAFEIYDNNHSDVCPSWQFLQLATRGDGSMGNAAMVKCIKGSDGSQIDLTYDDTRRPLTLVMTKDGNTLQNLAFEYNDYSQRMTVNSRGIVLSSSYGNSYQPNSLAGRGDSLSLSEQTYVSLLSSAYAFNFEERFSTGDYEAYGILQLKPYYHPDSAYVADSIRYQCKRSGVVEQEFMGLNYGQDDNRYQSVDVNQLILGVEHCNPYLWLSLYRIARSSRIITSATFEQTDKNITVAARLNANKSVQQLSVTRRGTTITYDFEY
jgi:hypothetical protein